jgi:hypothetical protein
MNPEGLVIRAGYAPPEARHAPRDRLRTAPSRR